MQVTWLVVGETVAAVGTSVVHPATAVELAAVGTPVVPPGTTVELAAVGTSVVPPPLAVEPAAVGTSVLVRSSESSSVPSLSSSSGRAATVWTWGVGVGRGSYFSLWEEPEPSSLGFANGGMAGGFSWPPSGLDFPAAIKNSAS